MRISHQHVVLFLAISYARIGTGTESLGGNE